ncbi:MAG: hypothetical protein LBF54_04140 [Holosporaceae bacterium]|nr:hypothetical protein [Holosporaceae bacterium]
MKGFWWDVLKFSAFVGLALAVVYFTGYWEVMMRLLKIVLNEMHTVAKNLETSIIAFGQHFL